MARGFYSLVQYCPDRFRGEAVNVGLVLLSLYPHAVRVQMTTNFRRAGKLLSVGGSALKTLKVSSSDFAHRVEASAQEMLDDQALAAFAATRANDLRMTEPRLAKLQDFDRDFDRLFGELVETRTAQALAQESPAELLPQAINSAFIRLREQNKVWQPGKITVPVFKRRIDIPYAYKNGVVNLVKPHVFAKTKQAENQAARLAVNGDLIKRHPLEGEQRQLIVISTQESTAKQQKEIDEHVSPLFAEYGVRLIRPQQSEAFADEIESSAH